jgi:N-acetylmuramoyl-L-alanine amidase
MVSSLVVSSLIAASVVFASPPSGQPGPEPQVFEMRHLKVIALDPGHGGDNRGCLGVNGAYEKELTLQIARRVQRILMEETSASVMLTRERDIPLGLRERARMANKWNADVFLSLHLNADPYGSGRGVETWFLSVDAADAEAEKLVRAEEGAYQEDEGDHFMEQSVVQSVLSDTQIRMAQARSESLATAVVDGMAASTQATLRGVRQARFGVLKEAKMPAIVVEAGFFSHRDEGTMLLDPEYQETVARGIVRGLQAYDAQLATVRGPAEIQTVLR